MVDDELKTSPEALQRRFLARGTARGMQFVAGLLLLNAVAGPLSFFLTTGQFRVSPALLGGLVALVVLFEVRRDRIGRAMTIFIWGGTLIPIWGLLRGHGLLDGNALFLPVAAMGAGFMLSGRQALLVTLVITLALAAVYVMEISGQPFGVPPFETRTTHAVSALFAVLLGAIVGARSTRAFRDQYEQTLELSRTLEVKVAQRTAELDAALTELRRTQDELVESGTLASLGSMVAGVSHELNTPIGNALMASTTAEAHLSELAARLDAGSLRRSDMETFLREAAESSRLCSLSIQRSADLVSSFKQVAIDRVSERRRSFSLAELADDILATLRPGLKRAPLVMESRISSEILLDSFPGPLGQVLTNLVQNALLHGLDGRTEGSVRIDAYLQDNTVEIVVQDDGVGISPELLPRIFEPFFTTRLGRGGSGLGLNICHRLVTRILGGDLRAHSVLGEGTQFVLRIPRVAPDPVHPDGGDPEFIRSQDSE